MLEAKPAAPAAVKARKAKAPARAGQGLRATIEHLRDEAIAREQAAAATLAALPVAARDDARNLLHYLALRDHDQRHVQASLSEAGLSSLGRSEADVLPALSAVIRALAALDGVRPLPPAPAARHGAARLSAHATTAFGPAPKDRSVRIMATLPGTAAHDPGLIRKLLDAGMDLARINCAHDDAAAWLAMIRHLRRATRESGRPCRVLMDLAGPKLRTGALGALPGVLHWKPAHDRLGKVTTPACVALIAADAEGSAAPLPVIPGADAVLPISGFLPSRLRRGDVVRFTDARGKHRELVITGGSATARLAEAHQGAWVEAGLRLKVHREKKGDDQTIASGVIAALPVVIAPLVLQIGDTLVLTADPAPGHPAGLDANGKRVPATIPCSLPEVFAVAKPGAAVWFDDGKIGAQVTSVTPARLTVKITAAKPTGSRLLSDKGINLPETTLPLAGLTADDLKDLDVAAKHADLIGLSFAQRSEDVQALQAELDRRKATKTGIVLKIETRDGFAHLPTLLLRALARPPVAVMVARGDLAVEAGFARLAEVQEEMLWLCEAARVPVIWGTQVLENLVKKGQPSRAEVTDAAMGVRAECVMLNKGPHQPRAVEFLADVLTRMQAHQRKKTPMLRRLAVSADR